MIESKFTNIERRQIENHKNSNPRPTLGERVEDVTSELVTSAIEPEFLEIGPEYIGDFIFVVIPVSVLVLILSPILVVGAAAISYFLENWWVFWLTSIITSANFLAWFFLFKNLWKSWKESRKNRKLKQVKTV